MPNLIPEKMITALIVAEDPLTRASLRQALEAQGLSILREVESGACGLGLARELCPDLILLDLDLRAPGLTGLQVGRALLQLDPHPLVVYVTVSSRHAIAAFEHGVLDYLVKPIAPERLAMTLGRARGRLAARQARQEAQRRVREHALPTPARRVPVWTPSAVRLIRIEEIDSAESREKLVYVQTGDGEYRTSCTMGQLETLLPPHLFLRIHISHIVRLERLEELLFLGNHRYAVRLSDGRTVPVGRGRYPALRQRLGLDRGTELESTAPQDQPQEALLPTG